MHLNNIHTENLLRRFVQFILHLKMVPGYKWFETSKYVLHTHMIKEIQTASLLE